MLRLLQAASTTFIFKFRVYYGSQRVKGNSVGSMTYLLVICIYCLSSSICNSYKYYIYYVQATSFDGVFLLVAFHCIHTV